MESLSFLEVFISNDFSLASFDFSGCGLSEGEFITLGLNESLDLDIVVKHINKEFKLDVVGLWGRSMGAVTALIYSQKLFEGKFMVIDSPFCNLKKLIEEIASKKTGLPKVLLSGLISMINNSIKKKANFELGQINVLKNIQNCKQFCCILASDDDKFVDIKNAEIIYDLYPKRKKFIKVTGDHNEARRSEKIHEIIQIIKSKLQEEDNLKPSKSNSISPLINSYSSCHGIKLTNKKFLNNENNKNTTKLMDISVNCEISIQNKEKSVSSNSYHCSSSFVNRKINKSLLSQMRKPQEHHNLSNSSKILKIDKSSIKIDKVNIFESSVSSIEEEQIEKNDTSREEKEKQKINVELNKILTTEPSPIKEMLEKIKEKIEKDENQKYANGKPDCNQTNVFPTDHTALLNHRILSKRKSSSDVSKNILNFSALENLKKRDLPKDKKKLDFKNKTCNDVIPVNTVRFIQKENENLIDCSKKLNTEDSYTSPYHILSLPQNKSPSLTTRERNHEEKSFITIPSFKPDFSKKLREIKVVSIKKNTERLNEITKIEDSNLKNKIF